MATKTKDIENVLQAENKKPPIINRTESQSLEKEINSEEEKLYLNGEPHLEEPLTKMKQITVKPRETYLKEKMNKINYSKNLISNIEKDMNSQIKDIKTEIEGNKVVINKETKDLGKIMENIKLQREKKLVKYSEVDYNLKKKHKLLKELRDEQNLIKAKISKIEGNEALLKSEGFINLNNSYEGIITPFDKSKKEQEMKINKNKINDLKERLREIEFRIEEIIKEDEDSKISKKEKLENFQKSINRDKELIEKRAEKYLKESKERNKRLLNDIDKLVEKRKKEIEKKEKEDEQKKKELIDKFKEKEKKLEKELLEENKKIMETYMPYRLQKLGQKKTDYTYGKLEQKYKNKENNLVKKINLEKKQKNKMITSEDLQTFQEKIETTKEKLKQKKEERDKKEKEKFEMCQNYKPKYISKFNEKIVEEMKEFRNKEKNQKNILVARNTDKKNIIIKMPQINEIKKKERTDNITKLEKPELFQKKYTLIKQEKNKRVILKKRNPDSKKLGWLYKLENLNNSVEIQNPLLIKKPKIIKLSSSFTQIEKNDLDPKKINYLTDLKKKREKSAKSLENIK